MKQLLKFIYYITNIIRAILARPKLASFDYWVQSTKLVRRDSTLFFALVLIVILYLTLGFWITLVIASILFVINITVFLFYLFKNRKK